MPLKDVYSASTGLGMTSASQDDKAFNRICTSSNAFSSAPDAVDGNSPNEHSHNGVIETGASPEISKRRHDSGYGGMSHRKDTIVSSPPSRPTSTDTNPLYAQTKSGSPRRTHTRSRHSHTSTSSSPASRTPHSRATSQPTIPTSSRRTTSRHSSTTHAPQSSPSSSRRSSKTLTQTLASNKTPRPLLPTRSSSTAYPRPRPEDPFSIHHRSCSLFQSHNANPSGRSPTTSSSHTNPSFPSPPHRAIPTSTSPPPPNDEKPTRPFIPATTIDWTHPSTRQAEYEKIDRSCRGLRGLWRRFAPRWCRGSSRVGFYQVGDGDGDDAGSDAGSVRRYRVGVPGGEGEAGGEEGKMGGRRGWGLVCGRGG